MGLFILTEIIRSTSVDLEKAVLFLTKMLFFFKLREFIWLSMGFVLNKGLSIWCVCSPGSYMNIQCMTEGKAHD